MIIIFHTKHTRKLKYETEKFLPFYRQHLVVLT